MTDHGYRLVHLTIDGQEVRCPADQTVYEAATDAGIHIPTFCHHPKLVPVGACRTCLVEIEGVPALQTSCTTPVREGMVVRVHTSPAAVKARRAIIEFLLTNHPLDCPVCDKGGECPLQDQAMLDGPGQSRYVEEKRHKHKRYPLGELIVLDQERCVLCWRCIRFLDEWADDHELDLFGRGADTRIEPFAHRPLSSKWQGNTIEICPVGALTSRVFRFEARVWELTNTPSVCPLCSVGCNILLGVKNNKLRRITPRENMEVNDAWICDKGRFAHGFVGHKDRLTTPLIRRDGQLQPASWDDALELVARRLRQVVEGPGSQAVAGLGSTRITNEAGYLFQRFMRAMVGSNNVDHLTPAPAKAIPPNSLADLEHADVVLLLGCDPSTEAPLVELWIKKAVLRHGAKVVVAHPRKIELSRYGGPWLAYRPGTEAALINGLAKGIMEAGLFQGRRQAIRVTNLEDLQTWLEPYGPQQVQETSGVSPSALKQAAEILVAAQNPIILYGPGWGPGRGQRPATSANLDALANLALLLGGIQVGFLAEDNNTWGALLMGMVPDLYPGKQRLEDVKARSRLASLWGAKLSPVPGLCFDKMVAAAEAGEIEAMWIMGADPATEYQPAASALGQIPFLVVQDLFLTDTASLAEVVLPAASFAETDGSFMNLTGRLQAIHSAMRPPGQARPDWWIIVEVARRMMHDARRQDHPAGQSRAWGFDSPADVLVEISKALPSWRGLSYDKMGSTGWQPRDSAGAGEPRPYPGRISGRAFVRVEPVLPPPDADADRRSVADLGRGRMGRMGRYPLTLLTGRCLYDRGTLLSRCDQIQKLVPEAHLLVHPADAAKLGLVDGDEVSVVSAAGRRLPHRLAVRISDEIAPGVVYAPLNLSTAPLSVLFSDRESNPQVAILPGAGRARPYPSGGAT